VGRSVPSNSVAESEAIGDFYVYVSKSMLDRSLKLHTLAIPADVWNFARKGISARTDQRVADKHKVLRLSPALNIRMPLS
jgi:hypothetical protein